MTPRTAQNAAGEPEVIFDLNERNPGEKVSTRTDIYPSPDGRYVGYQIHREGADMAEIHFYDTETGQELEEYIPTAFNAVTGWLFCASSAMRGTAPAARTT